MVLPYQVIAQTSSVKLPNPGTSAVATLFWNSRSLTESRPSTIDLLTITPSNWLTSAVSRIVRGAGEDAPGVNLNALSPHPSTVCPVDEYGVLQSLLISVGCARQKEPEEQVGVRSRFENP